MANEERKQLGQRVRILRKEENLSLRKFAEMIGISKDYLVDIEYGRKSPTLDTLVKVAGGFGMSLSELFEGVGMSAGEVVEHDEGADAMVRYFWGSM